MQAFHIGGNESDYVDVKIHKDNGDGWLSSEVDVVVGGFRGSFLADFNSWAFSDFLKQLEVLYKTISGSAMFTSYERQLELKLTCSATGKIHLEGEAIDLAGTGNKLIFSIELDQSHIPTIIKNLQSSVREFPPRAV